jgi:hypothetical protein
LAGGPVVSGFSVTLDAGAFAEAGGAASLGPGVPASAGSYAEAGGPSTFGVGLAAATGSYLLDANGAAWSPDYFAASYDGATFWGQGRASAIAEALGVGLPVGGGAYDLLGNTVAFGAGSLSTLDAGAGIFVVAGGDATLTYSNVTLTFRETLVAKLGSIAALTTIVGDAIYPGAIPETHDLGSDGPVLTYRISSYPHGKVLAGSDGTASPRVQLDAWSVDFAKADAITLAIERAIFRPPVNPWAPGGVEIMSVSKGDEFDIAEPPKAATDQWTYRVMSVYQIKHRVPIPSSS